MSTQIGFTLVDLFDEPYVLDCESTRIPGAKEQPLQVVASLSKTSYVIHVHETIRKHIGLYVGPAGEEKLHCVVGSGGTSFDVSLHIGARISLRSMTNESLIRGLLLVQFCGEN